MCGVYIFNHLESSVAVFVISYRLTFYEFQICTNSLFLMRIITFHTDSAERFLIRSLQAPHIGLVVPDTTFKNSCRTQLNQNATL